MASTRARHPDTTHIDVERVDHAPAAPVRRSVEVGSVHDPAEATADRMAERALALSAEYAGSTAPSSSGVVHRSPTAAVDGLSVSDAALSAATSGGNQLDATTRERLESGFGTDLGGVRVHTGPQAADLARNIHARAFTHGRDVYFGEGEYRPGTPDGDHVLAHEVAHTVQSESSGEVHRFPATWRTSPVPWKGVTQSVFRPGEGISGGVYILTSKDDEGPVKKAVVKPVFGRNALGKETGQQLQFSDAALAKLLGISAPESKVVTPGTEFNHLVDLCRQKQPPPTEGEAPQSLADAESFVVMSEVPNGVSIAGLAEKAPTDKRASADLHRAVFDPVFLAELGKLCIGDLMLGNQDRMVFGAMNLGNVMLSMQDGRARLAAIDTTTVLPRVVPPEKWADQGGTHGGFNTVKSALAQGPGAILDGFFEILVRKLKTGTPDDAGPMPTWEVIEATYKSNREHFVASFDYGWNDAMITALALSEDDDTLGDLTSGYDDEDVSTKTLKANLAYFGGRALGKSHEDSIGRSLAITASEWVSTVNEKRFAPPSSDPLAARSVEQPTGKVVKADVVPMPSLPTSANLAFVLDKNGRPLQERDYKSFRKYSDKISSAHREVDEQVSATKSRRKRPFGRKEELPRNRSVVSHYVAHSVALTAGGGRMADAATYAARIAQDASPLLSADYRGNEAAPVKTLLKQVAISAPILTTKVSVYKRQLAKAAATIPQTKHGDTDLTKSIAAADQYLDAALAKLDHLKKMNLQKAAAAITAKPK